MCIYMLIIYLLLMCYGYHLNTITWYDILIDFTFKYSIMYFNVFYFKLFLASCCPFFLSQINLYWKGTSWCFSSGDLGNQFKRASVVSPPGQVRHIHCAPHRFLPRLRWKSCKSKILQPSWAIDSWGQLKKLWYSSCTGELHTISGSLGQSLSPLQAPRWVGREACEGARCWPKGCMAWQRDFSPAGLSHGHLGTLCLSFPSGRGQHRNYVPFTTLVRERDGLDVLQLIWVC